MAPIRLLTALICVCAVLNLGHSANAQPGNHANPKFAAWIQKAQTQIGQGKFVEAEKTLRGGMKNFGNAPGPNYLLGYALHAQKKYDEALAAYEKAKTGQNVKSNTLYNMACIYSLQGKIDKSFAMLDKAVAAGFKNFGHMQGDSDLAAIRKDPRFKKYKPQWLPDSDLFVEKTRVIHKWIGEAAGDQFGWTARRVGDLDQDGITDFITTAPTHNRGAGKVYVYSSKTGKLLHQVAGKKGARLGNSAVGLGDVNGDKVPDFIAGAPQANGNGAAFVYSGKDASVIHSLAGSTPGGQFGYEVSELGDINGDGTPDFLVGAMTGDGKVKKSGIAFVYSGKDATKLFELKGEQAGDNFGNAAAAAKVGKGEFLLAIGAQNSGAGNRGQVYVYSVKDAKPQLKFKIQGDKNSVNLGQMFISFPGDLNRDGVPDVYASDFSDNTSARGGGKVVVHSGADGKELLAIHGTVAGEGLGTSPSDAGDVDGDGIGDLVIGAWQNREGAASGGKVYLYSAAGKGRLLRSWTCKQSGDTLGFDACGIGDVDGDGFVDFLLTSAWSNRRGQKTGRVFIVAGENFKRSAKSSRESSVPLKAGKVSTVLDNIEAGTGGLNVDSDGNLYTADFGWRLDGKGKGGNRLYKVSPDGKKATLFCKSLRGGSGNTFDSKGNLFQSNIGANSISKIAPDGTTSVYCKQGLRNPVGLVFDKQGDLFVCNCGANTIQRVSPDGTSKVFCKSSLLKVPNGITMGPDGMFYVCNFGNGDVVQIDQNGNASKLATLPRNNNGHLIFHRGYLYVIARTDCRVYRIDLAGRVVPFVGSGKRGKKDGEPMASSFSLPNSLIISPDGKWMYINETSPTSGDHRILGPSRIRRVELKQDLPDEQRP